MRKFGKSFGLIEVVKTSITNFDAYNRVSQYKLKRCYFYVLRIVTVSFLTRFEAHEKIEDLSKSANNLDC